MYILVHESRAGQVHLYTHIRRCLTVLYTNTGKAERTGTSNLCFDTSCMTQEVNICTLGDKAVGV